MQMMYAPSQELVVAQSRFMSKVFGWMGLGLGTTALVAFYVAANPNIIMAVTQNSALLIGLMIAQLGLVVVLSAAINKLSPTAATGVYFLYSALMGITLSTIFLIYTASSIASTFVISSATFGAMCVYGYVTKKDLTSLGSLAFMGLIGIIIASVVNIFMKSPGLATGISYIGVLVFVGLTAYDAQNIKRMGPMYQNDAAMAQKGAILGALRLYLDFINLFLMLLQIFGDRRR